MDHIKAFIVDASKDDIVLYLDNGALKTRAPNGAINEKISAFIRANKPDIIACLASGFVPARTSLALVPASEQSTHGLLSLAQERFWFINQLGGDSALYNMPIALRIRGPFDPDIAERALQRIVERHAPLHSVYANGPDGSGLQQPRRDTRFTLDRIDLADLSRDAQEERIAVIMRETAGTAFNLGEDLMLRGTYITQSPLEGVLLLCVHHIAADGWSFLVMKSEFAEQYRAILANDPDPLAPLRITYADYAKWQRDRLDARLADADLAYWERQLANLPAVHSLPLDHPRSDRQSHQGRQLGFRLDAALYAQLKQLARANNITLFMVLHGAFALMIARYSNSEDIVIGTPVLNRLERELELLIGCFVNTLVLRVKCSAEFTVSEFLQHVKAVNLEAQSHQEMTFDQIVDHLNPVRTTLYTPLYQIMFSMGMPQVAVQKKRLGIEIEHLPHEGTTAKHDLCLYAEESFGELFFGIEYKDDLFDRTTIEGMADRYQTLLGTLVARPEVALSQLSLLDESQSSLLNTWSDGDHEVIEAACLHEQVEHQAERRPDAIAVVCEDGQLTYAQLNARANRLAQHLRAHGVGAEALVAVCVERSLHLAVAILAVWKAGGAYVPLDPAYPAQRISDILDDTQTRWVLSQTHLRERFADIDAQVWAIDDAAFEQSLAAHPSEDIDRAELALAPTNLAYVIFTSGSTGRPKGVMVEHRSAVNLGQALRTQLESAGVKGACRWAWNASVSFDASVQALTQWACGSTLYLLPESLRRDPADLLAYLQKNRIDVLDTTPLHAELLLNALEADITLPVLVIGGEAIGPALWERIAAHYAGSERRALNVYGPTETCVDATSAWIESGHPTIGRPLANVRCHVLDRNGQVQPMGALGELHIGGAGVARGYLNRPELTAERFVEITLNGIRERVYRSGDTVRWLPDGTLEFIGRSDGQVKIRGYRVELGEIEHRLRQLAGVTAAAVTARGEEVRELVAYIVRDEHRQQDDWIEPLRQALRASLPAYMLPSHFVALDALPLTTSGKLDVAALPAPGERRATFSAPTRPAQVLVANVWSEQLKLDAVGIDENFFELGGHSILAARVVSRLTTIFQLRIPLRFLFEHPTVREFVVQLDELGDARTIDDIAEVYLAVSSLDDGEVQALLAAPGNR